MRRICINIVVVYGGRREEHKISITKNETL